MAQAKHVPIPIRARIIGASLTTSTKSIRSACDATAGHPALPILLNQTLCALLADVISADRRTVAAVSWRLA